MCDPHSPAYTDAVFQALDLDGPEYSTVDADIMKGFKELICQYPTEFLLPGSPLTAVKGFEHRIDTADAPPIYSHPYKKSPEELRAIKTEIKWMLLAQDNTTKSIRMGFPMHPGPQTSRKR